MESMLGDVLGLPAIRLARTHHSLEREERWNDEIRLLQSVLPIFRIALGGQTLWCNHEAYEKVPAKGVKLNS